MKTILVTLAAALLLMAVALALLGVKALFVKGGSFPSGHVHDLPARRRRAKARLQQRRRAHVLKKENITNTDQ